MEKRPEFNLEGSRYKYNPVFISRILDPYTAVIAKYTYKIGLTANKTTLLTFILGMIGIAVMYFNRTFIGLLITAILITLRNIGDTIDGKIARGTKTFSPLGGYSDIISDWLFFHAAFFVVLGIITNHVILGFLCVTGYMSREFARRKFTEIFGTKITETQESKRIPLIVSTVKKYDLASWFLIIPIIMIIQPVLILYLTVIIEYGLLFGELIINYVILIRDNNNIWQNLRKEISEKNFETKKKIGIKKTRKYKNL